MFADYTPYTPMEQIAAQQIALNVLQNYRPVNQMITKQLSPTDAIVVKTGIATRTTLIRSIADIDLIRVTELALMMLDDPAWRSALLTGVSMNVRLQNFGG